MMKGPHLAARAIAGALLAARVYDWIRCEPDIGRAWVKGCC